MARNPKPKVVEIRGAVGTGPIVAPCPKCNYAYADGGYCPDCGWTRPLRRDPYDTNRGRVYGR